MTDQERIELEGVSHLALVCSDMARTVDFYTNVLGLRLIKTVELPVGMGQHFFFDIGNGDSLAFFWFPDAPPAAPGIAAPAGRPDNGDLTSAVGSMNHIALQVSPERIEQARELLIRRGVECSEVVNHDDSEWTVSETMHPGVFVRSVYFQDPDGILLELAAWTKVLDEADVRHAPVASTPRSTVTTGSREA
jgi:catechol 2,3-dioxygenase-like lactoylglutathione lyase family enzyme